MSHHEQVRNNKSVATFLKEDRVYEKVVKGIFKNPGPNWSVGYTGTSRKLHPAAFVSLVFYGVASAKTAEAAPGNSDAGSEGSCTPESPTSPTAWERGSFPLLSRVHSVTAAACLLPRSICSSSGYF